MKMLNIQQQIVPCLQAIKRILPGLRRAEKMLSKHGFFLLFTSILGGILTANSAEAQIVRPFTPRFQIGAPGNVTIIGNTLMTCTDPPVVPPVVIPPAPPCAVAQSAPVATNASYVMRYVDVDGVADTFNSSSATLNLPPGATVLWAGLYWSGYSTNPQRNQVRFGTGGPGAINYITLTANPTPPLAADARSGVDSRLINPDRTGQREAYQGFVNVTEEVTSRGNATYWVANVQADTGQNRYGGWSLIVVYRDPNQVFRSLTTFDGFVVVGTGFAESTPRVDVLLTNFLTPPAGQFDAFLTSIAYEGDAGIRGDQFLLDGTPNDGIPGSPVSDPLNPPDDFFNGSISTVFPFTREPTYINQLGIDIDLINANADRNNPLIPNNASTAIATFTTNTTEEAYFPGVFALAIDSALLSIFKTGPASVAPGNNLTYTITVRNNGPGSAAEVVLDDPTPQGLTFVANAGDCTTPFPCDFGILRQGETRTVTTTFFVPPDYTEPTPIVNIATTTSITDPAIRTARAITEITREANLGIQKTQSASSVTPGNPITYTVTVINNGPSSVVGARITDIVPADIFNVSWTCAITTGTGSCLANSGEGNTIETQVNLNNGSVATFTINGTVSPTTPPGLLRNTATVTPPDGTTDPDPSDNTSPNDTLILPNPVSPTGIKSVRLFTDVDGSGSVTTGDIVEYTIIYVNNTPGQSENFLAIDTIDATQLSFVPGSYEFNASGIGTTVSPNPNYNGTTDRNLNTIGTLGAGGGRVTIKFRAVVTAPEGSVISNQASATSTNATVTPSLTDAFEGPQDLPQVSDDRINQGNFENTADDDPTLVNVLGLPQIPRLRLVKRITGVNRGGIPFTGINFDGFVDDSADDNDTIPAWPQGLLRGVPVLPSQLVLRSGDEVEYTIYFLSDGRASVNNFRLCDPITLGTTFVRNSFGLEAGILLNRAGVEQPRTNIADVDEATFFSPLAPLPTENACPDPTNPDGAVVVNLNEIPNTAENNYGFIRFRATID